jgi:peroxiredoxin
MNDALTVLSADGHPVRLGDLWAERTAVLLFVRHFGCIFCQQQLAAVIPWLDRIREAGAEVFVIGNGSVEEARTFRDRHELPMTVLTDPPRQAYASAGMRRGGATILRPQVLLAALRAYSAGFRQDGVAGDPLQQGGVVVVGSDGTERYRYVSRYAGDHPSPETILEHCSDRARRLEHPGVA